MSNFFVVLPAVRQAALGNAIFQNGLAQFRNLRNEEPTNMVTSDWVSVCSFQRKNGTGSPIVVDAQTGSWLVACGTWFHQDGYGVGQENRLLERYLRVGGIRLGQELEGFFVIIVGDQEHNELRVITDIIGSCHAFFRRWNNAFALCNSSLMLACLDRVTLDPIGCQEFLESGVVYEDRTVYREVKKLGPSQVYRIVQGGEPISEPYWQICDLSFDSLNGAEAVTRLAEGLSHATNKVLSTYSNPVCDLTGGYDSRLLVSAFLKSRAPFSTTVTGDERSPDVMISKSIAKEFGLSHLHICSQDPPPFHQVKDSLMYTDGECDMLEYSRILGVHRRLLESFDVSINGSFGEVARGYWWELLYPLAGKQEKLDSHLVAQKRYVTQKIDKTLFPRELRMDLVSHFSTMIDRANIGLENFPNTVQMDHAYLRLRMQRWQGRLASGTNQLWPCLSPCMFRSVLELMLQTSTNLRRRGLLVRKMLEKVLPKLAAFPLEHGWPAVPVQWNTFYKFWPLPVYYGKKVIERVIGARAQAPSLATEEIAQEPAWLKLWREEEVQDLFAASTLKVEEVVEPSQLKIFLDQSRKAEFAFSEQWSRLLSLEYALSTVKQATNSLPI